MRWMVAVLLVPLAAAAPDPVWTDEREFFGWATQGSRDEGYDWLDAWNGPHNWECTQSEVDDVYVLRLLSGDPTDVVVLETMAAGQTLRSAATLSSPAVAYGHSNTGCREFAVVGERVADAARFQVCIWWVTGLPEATPGCD